MQNHLIGQYINFDDKEAVLMRAGNHWCYKLICIDQNYEQNINSPSVDRRCVSLSDCYKSIWQEQSKIHRTKCNSSSTNCDGGATFKCMTILFIFKVFEFGSHSISLNTNLCSHRRYI